MATVRLYLTGRITARSGDRVLDQADLPGRQGRLLLAFLALHGRHPVSRDRLAEVLWGEQIPAEWPTALKVAVSKTRTALHRLGPAMEGAISAQGGTYQLRLGPEAWVDIEAAMSAIDRAEAAWRRGDDVDTWADATVASSIARRPFLPSEDAPWIDEIREMLRGVRLRALDRLVEVWLSRGHHALAISLASESVGLAPFRETSYRLQMRAHAQAGDRAEALRVYERCARLLAHELGVEPTEETRRLRDELARGHGNSGPGAT